MEKLKQTGGGGGETLVVPDVHLRIRTLEKILDAWNGKVVFLGDFFDDFNDTPERNLEMAVFVKERLLSNPDYTVLMGNHDLHYSPSCPRPLRCSGWEEKKHKIIQTVLSSEDFGRFQWAVEREGFLISHAGLHPRLVMDSIKGSDAAGLAKWINASCQTAVDTGDHSEPLLNAGFCRYGIQPVGGVIWMDVQEYQPVSKVQQIFGHTVLRQPEIMKTKGLTSYCIDTNLQHVATLSRGGGVKIFEVADWLERDPNGK